MLKPEIKTRRCGKLAADSKTVPMAPRIDGRKFDELRPIRFERNYTRFTPGSVLVTVGHTWVLCTCSVEEKVPDFLKNTAQGWLTAEYSMLPGSTPSGRARRETSKPSGRTQEIQRLIGRSLRMAVDLKALGPRTLTIDCDVLQADGGTRTAAITGGWVALRDALDSLGLTDALKTQVAAISLGKIEGTAHLDLCYEEDVKAEVDMNVVMTQELALIEIQATAEEAPLKRAELDSLLSLATVGISKLLELQRE
jgi:ribonuclease PH